jgi:hypothetical protein
MAKTRKLGQSERMVGSLFSTEKGRDRADARRQIEGLSQNDQVIMLLSEINERLAWLCDEMARQRPRSNSSGPTVGPG